MIYYSFADIGIAFELDNIIESPCFGAFRIDAAQFSHLSSQVTVKVSSETMPESEGLKLLYSSAETKGYFDSGTVLRFNERYDGEKYRSCFVSRTREEKCLFVADEDRKKIATSAELFRLCDLSSILLENGAVILHSSYIIVDGKAVLFSAPSGTGKSTQASLWQNHRAAVIANGDRTLIKRVDNQWCAFGVPFCGSSGICKNMTAPLAAIVMLEQGKADEITQLRSIDKIKRLLPEVSVQNGSPIDMNNALDLTLQLVAQTKIVGFSCTMNPTAVDTLESEVFGNG